MKVPEFLGPLIRVPASNRTKSDRFEEFSVPAAGVEIPIVVQSQLLGNWCWAAVTASIREWYEEENAKAQCAVASEFLARNCCPPGIDDVSNPNNRRYSIATALGLNMARPALDRPLRPEEIPEVVASNRPACCVIRWSNGQLHFVLLTGYIEGIGDVIVRDPLLGLFVGSYRRFTESYRDKGQWLATVATRGAR